MEDSWKSLKDDLLSAADKSCGWTKGPPRHQVTCSWNKDVDQGIKRKPQLWKKWKKGGCKESYLQYKEDSNRAVHATKKTEEERFNNINRSDSRKKIFKFAKQMKAENCEVVGDKCVKDDKRELVLTDAEKHLAWKERYERLLNEEFPWGKENLVFEEPVIGPRPQVDKERQSFWDIWCCNRTVVSYR